MIWVLPLFVLLFVICKIRLYDWDKRQDELSKRDWQDIQASLTHPVFNEKLSRLMKEPNMFDSKKEGK